MNLLLNLFTYAELLQQLHPQLTHVDVVADDSEITKQLKDFSQKDIGLFIAEPEVSRTQKQDASQEVVYLQFILAKKIADRITLRDRIAAKNEMYNLIKCIEDTIINHKEGVFSQSANCSKASSLICELWSQLDISTMQKTPIATVMHYIGWSLSFQTKLL